METRDKAALRKRRRQIEKLQENHRDLVFDWLIGWEGGEREAKDNTLI